MKKNKSKLFLGLIGPITSLLMFSMVLGSCSKDDNDDVPEGKKLVKLTISMPGDATTEETYVYDSAGRLKSSQSKTTDHHYGDRISRIFYDYTWQGDKIVESERDGDRYTSKVIYHLTGNLVSTIEDGKHFTDFEYNASGKVIQSTYMYKDGYSGYDRVSIEYEWKDGKLVKMISGSEETTFEYSGKKGKCVFPSIEDLNGERGLFFSHPELFGFRIEQLPDKMIRPGKVENEKDIITFTYEIDGEGYVKSYTLTSSTGYKDTITLEWK